VEFNRKVVQLFYVYILKILFIAGNTTKGEFAFGRKTALTDRGALESSRCPRGRETGISGKNSGIQTPDHTDCKPTSLQFLLFAIASCVWAL